MDYRDELIEEFYLEQQVRLEMALKEKQKANTNITNSSTSLTKQSTNYSSTNIHNKDSKHLNTDRSTGEFLFSNRD